MEPHCGLVLLWRKKGREGGEVGKEEKRCGSQITGPLPPPPPPPLRRSWFPSIFPTACVAGKGGKSYIPLPLFKVVSFLQMGFLLLFVCSKNGK